MNHNFKFIRPLIIAFAMIILQAGSALACHFAAADIYVKYTGQKSTSCNAVSASLEYDVYVIVYNACQTCTGEAGGTATIDISSATSGESLTLTLVDTNWRNYPNGTQPAKDTIQSLCPSFYGQNSCIDLNNANKYPAYKRTVLKGHVTLPSRQTDWVFKGPAGFSARNNSNIDLSTCGSIYVEAGLNNLDYPENSTPVFQSNPLPYICVNQPTVYLNAPTDINSYQQQATDSMYTVNQLPYTGPPGAQCKYLSGYSTTDPIRSLSTNPYRLNPFTGTATFTPINVGPYVLAYRCDMYERKTGKKLGYVYRDVQVSVLPCEAPPPPIDTIPQTLTGATIVNTPTGKVIYACPGANVSFTLKSVSPPGHTIYMYANNSNLVGSSFVAANNGADTVTSTFTWTPGTSDGGEHTLIVHSDDSSCVGTQPIILQNSVVFLIKVVPGLDAGNDLPFCSFNPQPRQLYVLGANELSVKWTDALTGGAPNGIDDPNIVNPVAHPTKTAYYAVSTEDLDKNSCRWTDTVSVYLDSTNSVHMFPASPLVLCRPDYLQLDAQTTGTGPISNLPCGMNVNQAPHCSNPDSIMIYGSPLFGKIGYDGETSDATLMPNNVRTTKQQFLIRKEDLREYGTISSVIKGLSMMLHSPNSPSAAAYYNYKNLTIGIKCTNTSELSAAKGFESNLITVYNNPGNITLLGNQEMNFPFTNEYNWDTTQNLLIQLCYSYNDSAVDICNNPGGSAPFFIYGKTTYFATLSSSPRKYDHSTIPPPLVPDPSVLDFCNVLQDGNMVQKKTRPVFKFYYCVAPAKPFNLFWTPGTLLSDSTISQPLAYVPKSIKYVVQSQGRSGCILRDSIEIYMPVHNFKVGPIDTSICLGQSAPMFVKNGFAYIWHEFEGGQFVPATSLSCTDCANPLATPKHTTTYKVEVSDSVFCFDTLTVTINVLPLPKVHILNNDTIVKYGQPFQLLVNGARTYNWQPVSSLNNPNISYPIATPTEPTQYIVEGLNAQGCRSYDTVNVGIDYRNRLFIPNAFSPNGDGKNDVFKVPNLTFERIMEFRVFNRWGQEIFSTTDSKQGWDGTWKGTPQDMGTYTYLIRVGYPDGLEETYKGNVTLVR